ncbi:hypothetical protein BDW72DRAFT_194934 [Aspergillus terricola var. indicus]
MRHPVPAGQSLLPRKKLLLCLDYGTTFTSVSYIVFDPDQPPVHCHPSAIRSIKNWPHASDANSPSVPSETWYHDAKCLWGNAIPKLLLENEADGTNNDPLTRQRQALLNVAKPARDAIRDYLMKAFKHVHGQLEKLKYFDNTWAVEMALCVPLKWSTYA